MRTRLILLLIVAPFVGAATCRQVDEWLPGPAVEPPHLSYSLGDVRGILAESDRLDELLRGSRRFHEALEQALAELRLGRLSLAEASARVRACALRDHPGYLRCARSGGGGKTDLENVARNLLTHVRERAEAKDYPADVLERVERELRSAAPGH